MSFSAVEQLSSDGSGGEEAQASGVCQSAFSAVAELSDSEEGPQPRKRKKKVKRQSREEKQTLVSNEAELRSLLGKPCKCRAANCLQAFTEQPLFRQLQTFRSEWGALHKLDQDQVAARP